MNQTLDQFFAAVKAGDLQRMGALWGTERGPANDWMKPEELRQRLLVMQRYLVHAGYRVVEGQLLVPGRSRARQERQLARQRRAPRRRHQSGGGVQARVGNRTLGAGVTVTRSAPAGCRPSPWGVGTRCVGRPRRAAARRPRGDTPPLGSAPAPGPGPAPGSRCGGSPAPVSRGISPRAPRDRAARAARRGRRRTPDSRWWPRRRTRGGQG